MVRAGLPSVQTSLDQATITNPAITNPFASPPVSSGQLPSPAPAPSLPVIPAGNSKKSSTSAGTIAGIVVGVVAAILIGAGQCWQARLLERW